MSIEELKHEKYHDYQDYVIARRDSEKQNKEPENNKKPNSIKPKNNTRTNKKAIEIIKIILITIIKTAIRAILFLFAFCYMIIWLHIGKDKVLIYQIIVQILLALTLKSKRKKLTIGDILTIIEIAIITGITIFFLLARVY